MKSTTGIALAATVMLLAGGHASAARHPGGENPLETVQSKFAAFDKHDVVAIQALYSRNATLHSPDHPDLVGDAGIAQTYHDLFTAIPDARDAVVGLDVSGDKVFAQYVLTGHLGGDANKPLKVRIISVYTVEGGRIVADSTYYDRKPPQTGHNPVPQRSRSMT